MTKPTKLDKKMWKFNPNLSTLQGVSANPGVARGRALVVPADLHEMSKNLSVYFERMNKGDILIMETAGSEFTPLLKKAGAVVTNQGGLMSHAAIASREMGIPCIVGIKNVTKIIKNDQRIEVDADKGVVKILN